MRRNQLSAILIVGALATSLAACGSSSTKPATTIAGATTTSAKAAFPSAIDGEFTVQVSLPAPGWWNGDDPSSLTGGYEYEMAKEIGKRLGLAKTVIKNVNFDTLVAGQTGKANKYDLALSEVTITDARAKVVQFTTPYFDADQAVMVNAGTKVTADNLKTLKWGVQASTTGESFVADKIKPSSAAKSFQDLATLFTALKAKTIDAIMMDTVIELPQAGKQNAEVVAQFKTNEQYGGIVPKDSKNLDAINKVIQAMQADGTLKKLADKWLKPEFKGDPTAIPYLQIP